MAKYLKVEIFVPEEYVAKIANALNENSLLKDGNYDYVFATSRVKGSFRPVEGASPFSGEIGVVNVVDEIKMEFRIKAKDIELVRDIIELNHPYEEPVVNFMELID